MKRHPVLLLTLLLLAIATAAQALECGNGEAGTPRQREPQVWSGLSVFFEKADWADWNLPENQDRITDVVWITRENTQGIFNIAQEDDFNDLFSPVDTEWATGSAADWASLVFMPWTAWHEMNPPSMIGIDAVVHLISEDIYLDIRMESWTCCGKAAASPTGAPRRIRRPRCGPASRSSSKRLTGPTGTTRRARTTSPTMA